MKHVRQTNGYNCGSACLAMVLGTTVEDVEERLLCRRVGNLLDPEPPEGVPPQIGVTTFEMECVLWDRGLRYLNLLSPLSATPQGWYDRVGDRLPIIDVDGRVEGHLNKGGTAILAVPSLTREDAQHWIAASGHDFYDPNGAEGNVYRSLDDFSPEKPLAIYEALLIERPGKCR